MKRIALLIFLCYQSVAFAQEPLLYRQEIESNEHKVVNAFEKMQKKPNKKRLKDKFIERYNQSVSEHQTRLNLISKVNQLEEKNWEGKLNELKSLQYLNAMANSSKVTSFIETKDYSKQIDSIAGSAVADLYSKGKMTFEKNENIFAMEIAYNFLKRIQQIQPNYKDTNSIIDLAVSKGTKNVFFESVKYENLGNYIEWGSNNSSASSDFINTKIKNDLSVDNVGSRFINSRFSADRIVELKWTSINISPERNNKYSVERSKKIKDNGQEKIVYATVNYNERFKDVSGQMHLAVKDVKTNVNIIAQNVSGNTFFSKVEASYTGDKRALTNEDWEVINDTNTYNFFNTEGYELTTKMYDDAIHQQVLNNIGRLLNWNYEYYD